MNKKIEERKEILKEIIDNCNDEVDLVLIEDLLTKIYPHMVKLRMKRIQKTNNKAVV